MKTPLAAWAPALLALLAPCLASAAEAGASFPPRAEGGVLAQAAAPAEGGLRADAVAPEEQPAEVELAQVLERARACIGDEAALLRVNALEYAGRICDGEGAQVAAFRYVYQKPCNFFRQETRPDGSYALFVRDELEAWIVQKTADGKLRRAMMPFANRDVERALAADRLNFYRGAESLENASATLALSARWNGRSVLRVDYAYPVGNGKMALSRLFDAETGRALALLSDHDRTQSIEEGEQIASGLRFPKSTRIYKDGVLVRRIEYDRVIVNGAYAPETFRAPTR